MRWIVFIKILHSAHHSILIKQFLVVKLTTLLRVILTLFSPQKYKILINYLLCPPRDGRPCSNDDTGTNADSGNDTGSGVWNQFRHRRWLSHWCTWALISWEWWVRWPTGRLWEVSTQLPRVPWGVGGGPPLEPPPSPHPPPKVPSALYPLRPSFTFGTPPSPPPPPHLTVQCTVRFLGGNIFPNAAVCLPETIQIISCWRGTTVLDRGKLQRQLKLNKQNKKNTNSAVAKYAQLKNTTNTADKK